MRLTELKLPLDHTERELHDSILQRLGIEEHELVGYSIFRRSHDARKRSAIVFIYTLDVEMKDEKALLARLRNDSCLLYTSDAADE